MAFNGERKLRKEIREIDKKVRNSFGFIRKDISEAEQKVEAMRGFLKKKEKQFEKDRKGDLALRKKLREEVEEFSQKIKQLRLASQRIREVEDNLVTRKDLAKIEERIKESFRSDIEYLKVCSSDFEKRLRRAGL